MIIKTKEDLRFFIQADRIMNGKSDTRNIREILYTLLMGGGIIEYLSAMRHYAYYSNIATNKISLKTLLRGYWGYRFNKLAVKLGFSIGYNSLGYGVVIPHYGTIVVNGNAHVGKFSVLHTSTCIAGGKEIGDYFYLSTGSVITGYITLGDGVTVAAHSLVNNNFDSNVLLAGSPAIIKRNIYPKWIDRDSSIYKERCERVEKLKVEHEAIKN